ncbi:MAG: PAS domain S-box protein [Bacteroidales bacterium]
MAQIFSFNSGFFDMGITDHPSDYKALRLWAEQLLKVKPSESSMPFSETELLKLMHSLELQQKELELQNEELRHLWAKTEVINDKYSGLYDFTPTGYFMLSQEGKIIELNLSGANMLGDERVHLKKSRFISFISESSKPLFKAFLVKAFESRTRESCEVSLSTSIGSPLFVQLNGICSANGEQCLVTMIDITGRKQAEEELRKSEHQYRIITDQSPIAIEFYDPEGLLVSVNPACLDLFGIVDQQEISRFSMFDDPNISEEYKSDLRQGKSIRYRAIFDFDMVREQNLYQTAKTGTRWLDVMISPTRDHQNEVNGYLLQIQDVTDNKQAEDLIRQTRTNYETFFNTIDDFLFVLDSEGNIIHTNATVVNRLGYTQEELSGKSILMIHPPERREEARKIVGEMLAGITSFCQVPILTRAGVRIPVETRVSHGFWDGKAVIFGVTKDISKVQLSEEKFSKLFHINPSACGLSDLDTHEYIEVNEAFFTLFGFGKDEVIGKTPLELGIMSSDTVAVILAQADSKGNVTNISADLKSKNGDIKHVLLSSENIYIQEKKYRYTVVHNITERKQAEDALKESEDKYRSLIQYSSDPIFSFNSDGTYRFVNEAFARVFGLIPADLAGKTPHFLFPYDEAERRLEVVRRVFLTGQKGEIEVKVNSKSGEEIYLLTLLDPIKNDEGKVLFVTCISKNITERKLAENEIRKLNESLEERVAERTQQLETANRELAIHTREMEQFSHIASHDLQEPLRTLTTFTRLLQEEYAGKLDEEGDKFIEFIAGSAERMRDLVTGLLEYSLLGKTRSMTTIDCKKVVEEVLADLVVSIKASHAKITVGMLPSLMGYESEFRMLFMNLISNAIKFRNMDRIPEIAISAENHGHEWVFTIADNGIGIDEKNWEKIFILFKRMHNRDEYSGTGIGLSHCKKIVELHGGKIWVNSKPGKGSTFMFTVSVA